jgi:hypothetical protein
MQISEPKKTKTTYSDILQPYTGTKVSKTILLCSLVSCMLLIINVSQRKSAIFVLSSIVAKSLADNLLLYKKNDGYGFHEENTGD